VAISPARQRVRLGAARSRRRHFRQGRHGRTWRIPYPSHDRDVLVTACGRICIFRKKINVSSVLAGQRLGIKEVHEGIWLVSFIDDDLGYIDLEQRTLQPVDNPFGPRLSPAIGTFCYLCLRAGP